MNTSHRIKKVLVAGLSLAALTLAGCAGMSMGQSVNVTLSGSEEVPPVATSAKGSGTINIAADKSVSGSVTTMGLGGVAAHIHQGARGKNGPVSVGLVKTGDNVWSVPAGAKLTDAQYDAFKAGELYVNVHTPANKGGEIRGQLQP
ncbi:MAG: CHRD domain-containing protein [Betaproteobacteria bacterium]|nr:CHRD domain-containing protein [Betaproteobacteria bacterium]